MLHNIPLGNTTKPRRTKDVGVGPATSSNTPGEDGTSSDGDSGQAGGDSGSEVEISDSEAEVEHMTDSEAPDPKTK